jgi:hypothetical protein
MSMLIVYINTGYSRLQRGVTSVFPRNLATGELEMLPTGIYGADHVTTLYQQTLTLTSQTIGGRSVGIVRSQTKAMELVSYIDTEVHTVT